MKNRISSVAVHLLIAGVVTTTAAIAGSGLASPAIGPEHDHEKKAQPEAMDEQMEAWMKVMAVGEQHEWLAQFEGEWETVMRMWMVPGAEPIEAEGKASNKMILGGRYLVENYSSDFMGMPFHGRGTTGFDNNRRLFVGSWIDNMNTGMSLHRGSLDPTGKILTMIGSMDEPTTGEIGKAIKYVTTVNSEDRHTFEAYEIIYGDPIKVFEMVYERVE